MLEAYRKVITNYHLSNEVIRKYNGDVWFTGQLAMLKEMQSYCCKLLVFCD